MSGATPIRPTATDLDGPPLAAAASELNMARSLISMLHDVYAHQGSVLIESIQADMPGVLYDVLLRIQRAEALVNCVPHNIAERAS